MYCPKCGWLGLIREKRGPVIETNQKERLEKYLCYARSSNRSTILTSCRWVNAAKLNELIKELSAEGKITVRRVLSADKPATYIDWA